ncbi:MAG: ABC transporter substrate-binding protein [Ramlibacter sp.]|nr:ABC transporter substrate-binding protein [Ramlibacter sp.]
MHSYSRRELLMGMGAAMAFGALPSRAAASSGSAREVVAGSPAHIVNYLPHLVAMTEKLMAPEGLSLKLISSNGGSKLREIVAAGQVMFGLGDSSHAIQLINRARPAKILLAIDERCPYTNVVIRKDLHAKGLTTLERLAEWKRPDGSKPVMAVSTIGGGQHVYASYVTEQMGLDARFHWVGGGVTQTMVGGLKTGKFDAIVAAPSWQLESVAKGFGAVIFDATDVRAWNKVFKGPVPVTCIYALQSTVEKEPELVQKYVNGIYRSLQWIKTASPEAIWNSTGEKYLADQGKELALKELAFYKPMLNYSGLVSASSFRNGSPIWFRESTGMKPVTFEEAVDLRFISNSKDKYG